MDFLQAATEIDFCILVKFLAKIETLPKRKEVEQ
jgi:hypothetical protein